MAPVLLSINIPHDMYLSDQFLPCFGGMENLHLALLAQSLAQTTRTLGISPATSGNIF